MYDVLNMLLDSVCQNFAKNFSSMFINDIGLQFSFFVAFLSGFGIRVMVASQNEFGSLPSSAIFWKSLRRIGVSSSLNFWQNSAVKPSGPGVLFAGRFLISFNFCACDGSVKIFLFLFQNWILLWFFFFLILFFYILIFILDFLFLPGSVLESCAFLRICPFLPSCQFYRIQLLIVAFMILCISVLSVVISPFSFLILLI